MTDLILLVAAVGALDAPAAAPPRGGGSAPSGVSGAVSPGSPGSPAPGVRLEGRVVRGSFANAAGERAYVLHLPDGAAPPTGRPLVVMLHGCTQVADDLARGTRLQEVAAARGWMVLFPEQPATQNPKKCWNWYDPAHQQRDAGEPSIIAGMTAQMVAEHGGDPRQVFLAGVSAGAAMASLVAAAYPEQFAALALHSGLVHAAARTVMEALGVMQHGVASPEPFALSAFEAMGSRARVIPTLVIHGEADAVVAPINGAQAARQWFLTNSLVRGQALDTTSGATDRSEREEDGYLVRRSTYRAKDGTPLSRLVMIRGLRHAWSGGAAEGSFTDPRGPDASTLVVDFFASVVGR
ncbi:MAG: PHB depolymerase family esterase [Gemmatimonadota bacterium]